MFEVLSVTLNRVSENPNIIEADRDCGGDTLSYDTVVHVHAADGSIAGAFYLTMHGDAPDELRGRLLAAAWSV